MASYDKMYLHAAASPVVGTLPGAGTQSTADSSPTFIATGGDTNRSMNNTIGVSQTSLLVNNQSFAAAASNCLMGRWVSELLTAQTISAGNWAVRCAASESSTNANMNFMGVVIYVWRPGTGARIGYCLDLPDGGATEPGTVETAISPAGIAGGAAVAAQAGDVLVCEAWCDGLPSMAALYTVTFFYDGTVEASATDNAAYILAPAAITFQDPVVARLPPRRARLSPARPPAPSAGFYP